MAIFATQKTLASLAFRLGEMDSELRTLKTANKQLELEFTDLFDKVRHQMSRMAKRDAVSHKENGGDPPAEPPDLPFPEADPVSRSIMMRRARQGKA